jgi:hypothetical protein
VQRRRGGALLDCLNGAHRRAELADDMCINVQQLCVDRAQRRPLLCPLRRSECG